MSRFRPLAPLFLLLFALLVRVFGVMITGFDGLYGQDSFAYFNYALALREALSAGNLPPPFFWPIGYPALVALATLLIGPQVAAGQLVSLFTGATIAPLVYWIVLEIRPHAWLGGVVAALLATGAAQLTLYSVTVMSDASGLFWATASAWLLLRTFARWQTHRLVLAAGALTLAIMTRWVYGLLAIPWGLAGLLSAREARLPGRRIAAIAAIALVIGGLGITSQFINSLGGELAHTGNLRAIDWHPANAFKSMVQNANGIFDYGRPTGLYYLRPTFHPAYIFPLLTPFILLGVLAIKNIPRSRAALLSGWPLIIYFFLAGITLQNWRFPLALFSPLAVLVGVGFDWLWVRLTGRWRTYLLVYCAIALSGGLLWAVQDVGNFTSWAHRNKQIAMDVGQGLPADAILLTFDLTATFQHYTALETHELYALSELDLQKFVRDERDVSSNFVRHVYLLINPENVQTQWVGKSPAQNFDWLQAHTQLTPIAQHAPFVLYLVEP
jgi:hypothetical protein